MTPERYAEVVWRQVPATGARSCVQWSRGSAPVQLSGPALEYAVLHGPASLTSSYTEVPTSSAGWNLAMKLESAYGAGRTQIQLEMRRALGLKQ